MEGLKRTALYRIHQQLGGKIVEFGGFEMPVQYTSIIEEHRRVRERVGLFDVSHMGEVEIRGTDALAFVQRMTINDASRLTPGRVQYSAMCYDDGGIVDDMLVYHMGDHYLLVINAANIDKDVAWLRDHLSGNVTMTDRSDEFTLIAIQGPRSLETLRKLTPVDLQGIQYYHYTRGPVCDVEMMISRTGYTGELGFELYLPSDVETSERIWNALMAAGKEFGIGPAGLGARDTLRLEMGFCLYGHDIDRTTNPIEAGLGWITKLDKGEFIGRSSIQKVKIDGPKRKLIGFALKDKAFPRPGYTLSVNGREVGTVTSGTFSPILDRGIGMGYVKAEVARTGTDVSVSIRDRDYPASITPFPFVERN
ncbi:MAG TPA: glycine cleavage system aminomethyltransferase GcvT [Bacteroidota bacterium]|nr:glycine cleavage system aminomethyltransferase GcvT [Bacteroidota bacterium]